MFAFLRCHRCHLWIDTHSLTSVLHSTCEIMVIKLRIVREECWEDLLDRERTVHGWFVIITGTEWIEKVNDVLLYINKVWGKVGICLCKFLQASALEGFVVCRGADIYRNVMAELFGKGTTWIVDSITKELGVFQFASFLLYIMQGILERNLLVWMRS